MASREEVYKVIGFERQYQNLIWGGENHDKEHSVGDWLIFIRGYYDDAVRLASHLANAPTQDMFRKLAALCFACMETNGFVTRTIPLEMVRFASPRIQINAIRHAIDFERKYQENLSSDRTDGNSRSSNDYLLMFGSYLHRAEQAWTDNPGDLQALDDVRKLAAIAVRCMEEHGAPYR